MSAVSSNTVTTMAPLIVSKPTRKASAETPYNDQVPEYFENDRGNRQAAEIQGRKGWRCGAHGPPGDSSTPRRYLPYPLLSRVAARRSSWAASMYPAR